ncbi:MAG: hypothetical protein JJT75_14685 [Opitutales bacterium]|nr:hypothetical protein [Opitutales bacterium]MCH8540079.1 hypothetical protein [Opitutales bacterium]
MHFKILRISCLYLSLLFSGGILWGESLSEATREFRNQHGQRFNASVVSVEGDMVTLRRSGDNLLRTPISSLRESDQQFVNDWHRAYLIANHLQTSFSDSERRQSLNDDIFRDGQTVLWGYQILFENRGSVAIHEVPIRYRVYYHVDHGGGRSELSYEEFTDTVEEVNARSRFLYSSNAVLLRQFGPTEGTLLVGHEGLEVRDEIAGIVLYFEPGDFRLDPVFNPGSLADEIK